MGPEARAEYVKQVRELYVRMAVRDATGCSMRSVGCSDVIANTPGGQSPLDRLSWSRPTSPHNPFSRCLARLNRPRSRSPSACPLQVFVATMTIALR
jgi:hypothetical protein